MSKWVDFQQYITPTRKQTKAWAVQSKDGKHHLGIVQWYSGWRSYGFYPQLGTVFEWDCLRDIADFCEQMTKEHKEKRKAAKVDYQEFWEHM